MSHALIIMRLTLRLILRKGTLWAMLAIIVGLSTMIFYMARSDGSLAKELEIRLSYSYSMTYNLLTFMIIALSCFTIRYQIDAKNIHLMTSMPVQRKWIVLGQALALVTLAFCCQLVLLGSLLLNSWFFSSGYKADELSSAKEKYFNLKKEVLPQLKSRKQLTLEYAKRNEVVLDGIKPEDWDALLQSALREEQLIGKGQAREWKFDLGEQPQKGKTVSLTYRFQKAKKRSPVEGTFEMIAAGESLYYRQQIKAHQYSIGAIAIPIDQIPVNGRFSIKFTNTGDTSVILSRSGLKCRFEKGDFTQNLIKTVLLQTGHLGVVALVGLFAGIGLTFSVASFMVIMLYLLSAGQGLFVLVVEDMKLWPDLSFLDKLIIHIMEVGMWLTKGMSPPEVSVFCAGKNIEWSYFLGTWLPLTLFYGLLVFSLASWSLSRKELDKIQT